MAKRIFLLLRAAGQVLSGAIAYYACEMLCDYLAFRDGGNALVARLSQLFFFPILALTAFSLLTMAWHKLPRYEPGTRYPEVFMIIGAIVFMPIYFELASHLIYNPGPILLSEVRKELFSMYVLFPLSVIEIGTYTLSLHALALAGLSAVLTGYLLRNNWRGAEVKAPSAEH